MKRRRVLLVVLLACVLSFACAFVAACKHTHVADATWHTDAEYHWHECTEGDGAKLDKAAHEYTDDQDTTCNVCGYERTVTPPVHTHTADTVWQSDETKHWHNCVENDGAKLDEGAHVDANSDGKCDVCDYTMTTSHVHVADATWHTDENKHWHECTAGDGAKLDEAAHEYTDGQDTTCNVCGYERTVTPPEHTHTAGSEWLNDGTYHWNTCSCGEVMNKAVHTYDNDQDATCNVCEYVRAVTPIDYTANGEYVLDIANAGANNASIYAVDNAAGNGFAEALDGTKYFKLSSSGSNYDCLYISLKLQAKKVITLTGTMRPGSSGRTATLGITLDSTSTGTVSGIGNVEASAETVINKVITVSTEGNIKLVLKRATNTTGVEFLDFKVTISDPEPVNVESVALDKNNSALKVGATETLVATVSPANADNTNIIWSSSDDTIATVVNGVVTAKKAGTVTITATSEADSTKSDSCSYTISNVAPTSIELNRTTATIAVSDTLTLTANVLPANATVKTVTWSSSDETIATVDASGVVTALKAGSVTITATATDNASVKAECTITIKNEIVYAESISLNYTNEALKVEDTLQLTATITPDNTDDKSVTWETSNASVATVNASGLVTVVGEGTATITATSNSNSSVTAECTINATYQKYTVTFMSDGANAGSKEVIKGQTTTAIELEKKGYAVEGWYESSTFSGSKFDFSTAITKDTTLYAKWIEAALEITYKQGNLESAAIEWGDDNAAGATVSYKLASAADSSYVAVDNELIRQVNASTARVDVVGLKGGEKYTFKIKASNQGESLVTLDINKHDRSGYAHFGYSKGVGAYNDDGTLKENAIVLYVTDENKNTVTLSYGGVTVTGIGNILNSVGQDVGGGLAANGGTSNTNQGVLKLLADANIPLVVRFIGCVSDSGLYKQGTFAAGSVSLIDGLTVYNTTGNGGTKGDNGHMARMKSAKDVTLEGIGEDATIDGWGFHFMRSTSDKDSERGTSFEVRNLTFINTPEDAVGMEGTQGTLKADGTVENAASASADILGSVERCWVHNNEFYCPTISGPAESDKAQGDGSCDFKRGQYFTCSYNYFEGCHKTNLVGSSDSSLQYNLTYHHNYWKYCEARGPLARRANIHMYNNVFEGQSSYAMNPRADSYIFSEYNLFYMCKNPQDVAGGALKSYKDSFSSCINAMTGTVVTDKSQTVSNNCKFTYRNIDYSKFDTTASQSYIPDGNYQLQESVTEARKYIEAYCGVTKRNAKAVEDITLSDISVMPSGVTPVAVAVPSTVTPGKISKTVYAFTLDSAATVTLSVTGGVLVNQAGECLLSGSGSTVLMPGTYMVQPMNFQPGDAAYGVFKECTITSIAFEVYDSEELNQKLIADYNAKATLVEEATIAYDTASLQLIKNAQNAYALLNSELQSQVSVDYSVVTAAYNTYVALGVADVEGKIAAIGTVDVNSGSKISAARNAYQSLISVAPTATVSNYATLVAAEETYEGFKVQGLINQIDALADPATATTEEAIDSLLAEYNTAKSAYEDLDVDQKAQVTNYSKVTDGIATLTAAKAPYEVKAMIAELPAAADVTLTDGTAINAARKAYDALTEAQKAVVGDITKLTEAEAALTELAATTTVAIFGKPANNTIDASMTPEAAGFTVSGTLGYKGTSQTFTYNGVDYNSPMKIQSSNTITFNTSIKMKVTIMLHSGGAQTLTIDGSGTLTADANGIIEYTVEAGSHTIGRVGEAWLCYIVLSPAA